MYLIDSSAWIEFFRPDGSRKVKDRVREILEKEKALCCGIVIVEIPRGAKEERVFRLLKETLSALPQIAIDESVISRLQNGVLNLTEKENMFQQPTFL